MSRTLLYCAVCAIAASCKSPASTPVVEASVDASIETGAPLVVDSGADAHDGAPIDDAANDASAPEPFFGSNKIVSASDADAHKIAEPFLHGASFAHPVFLGDFGPSPQTLFGITHTDTMSPYAAIALAYRGDKWIKVPIDPLADASWSGWQVDSILFEDIDQSGVLAPIVIAEYMTGIGPTGAQPFVVVSAYRWKNEKMARARDVEKILSGAEDAKTIRSRLAARKAELRAGVRETPKNPPL